MVQQLATHDVPDLQPQDTHISAQPTKSVESRCWSKGRTHLGEDESIVQRVRRIARLPEPLHLGVNRVLEEVALESSTLGLDFDG